MNSSKMFDAMTQIDERLIDRSIKRKNSIINGADGNSLNNHNVFALRKVLPIAVSFVLIVAVSLTAVMIAHYSKPYVDENPTDQMLKVGFDFDNNKSVSGAKIAVMTEKSRINVGEDLPVSIYSVCSSKNEKTPSSTTAKILMSYSRIDQNNMIETVKLIDDGTDIGYTWNGSFEQMKCDDIVVPAAVFTKADKPTKIQGLNKTDGVIVWALEVNKEYPDGSKSTERDSAAMYYKIEDNEVYLKPSDETMELAKIAVVKLQQGPVFMPGVSSNLNHTLYDEYEYTAKWVAPELITLETKSDTAVALIELYEDVLKEYRACDLDKFYAYGKMTYEYQVQHGEPYPDSQSQYVEEFRRILDLQDSRMVIEALLALDFYYDQLGEQSIQRMMNDFIDFAAIDYASASKVYKDASNETMFDMYRGGKYGSSIIIQ